MSDPDYHIHTETPTTEVAVVLHVQGSLSNYDLTVAAEKMRQLLRWDSIEQQGRECSLIFTTAHELTLFDVADVAQRPTSPRGTCGARPRESSAAPS